ncbi:TAP-like protein [Jatrophihabitans endophyticus]|uniref:TAP-like protein n=1 Tax=Jatrophihabitans endophyticus TaxID=1206085 RepID=A0A1M5CUY6_9ACTN|nr:alpha/beta fold hydrolase [Jatrophihabitans endophyticus]SHF58581.1 TAP-like protein [Jatrophihabitans endophyticus]
MRLRVFAGAAAACGVLALGVVPAQAAGAARAGQAAQALTWQTCKSPTTTGAALDQCATLQVPLSYADPGGAKIGIAVIRHRATDQAHRIGSLLWNPGGPGGSGTASQDFAYPYFPAAVRARFDIVSFDPRGIGNSSQLQCFDTPEQENAALATVPAALFPANATEEKQEIAAWGTFAKACHDHGGPIQYHMGTANVARDVDAIRAAVGDATLNYWGPSYGSYLGETYANLFPQNVGHIVLDGNVSPKEWNDAAAGATFGTFDRLNSAQGTEVALQMFLSQCGSAGAAKCAFAAGSPIATAAKYQLLLRQLDARPATVNGTTFTRSLTVTTTAGGLEYQNANPISTGWAGLATQLQAIWTASTSASGATNAPGVTMTVPNRSATKLAGAFAPSIVEGTYGVLCSESPNPADPNSYQAQSARANKEQSPSGFGSLWTWQAEPCAQWQARDAERYTGPFDKKTPPLLAIGTKGDTNTAYTSTLKLPSQLNNVHIITEDGGGHTALFNPSSCILDAASSYYINGTLPAAGTVCQQDKPPF